MSIQVSFPPLASRGARWRVTFPVPAPNSSTASVPLSPRPSTNRRKEWEKRRAPPYPSATRHSHDGRSQSMPSHGSALREWQAARPLPSWGTVG